MTKNVIVLVIFTVMNLFGFFLCLKDKRAAKKDSWRVSEKSMFLSALCWGGIGVYLSMLLFRHKTKHWYFMIGIPVCIAINIFTLALIL